MAEKVINDVIIKKQITNNDTNRKIVFDISEDSTQAFITTVYDDERLEPSSADHQKPAQYTVAEIRDALEKAGINNGIINENVNECAKSMNVTDLIIARGVPAIADEDDIIDVKYQKNTKEIKADEEAQKIDYRNVGAVTAVKKGDIIAVLITGKDGSDGVDIFGKAILRKKKKKQVLKAGDGCAVRDGDKVEALIDGEPYFKSNTFYVYGIHTVSKDVSLETGDIIFIGNIKINGSVKEGMKVEAGNSLIIEGSTENSNVSAKGDILISGNSIMTTITAGGKDMKVHKYITLLEEARDFLMALGDAMVALKRDPVLGSKIVDGEMIKALIEKKFIELPKRCWGILRESFDASNGEADPLADIIRGKLIGMAPLQIRHFGELDEIVNMMNERIEVLSETLALPVNIKINYCQDCNVQSSGDITVYGSGEYVSNLSANKGIYFTKEGSIARGGVLKANTEISCKVVGSQGGVKTKLVVPKKGHIRIDLAYQNTIVSVGGRESVIEVPSTNVHAYMKDRELIVDKLKK